jgi:hypothetical protein
MLRNAVWYKLMDVSEVISVSITVIITVALMMAAVGIFQVIQFPPDYMA